MIYLGWLMAGKVQGYAKAAKRYRVAAVCGVGMGASGSQLADVRKANSLGDALPLFTLQGGFDMDKLNVNGGAIALGHPVGASGCRILVTLLHEMAKRDAKKGLATLCVGGGMGCSAIVTRD